MASNCLSWTKQCQKQAQFMTSETSKDEAENLRAHCWNDDKEEEGYLGTGGEHWGDWSGKCNPQERQTPTHGIGKRKHTTKRGNN